MLEPGKGIRWPDVLGCGHWPLFTIATRVIGHWRAIVDFEASSFVGVSFRPECGTRLEDGNATYQRQRSGIYLIAIVEGSWSGAKVFTTDLSSAAFFCTQEVVDLARAHRHGNFGLVPAAVAGWSTRSIR